MVKFFKIFKLVLSNPYLITIIVILISAFLNDDVIYCLDEIDNEGPATPQQSAFSKSYNELMNTRIRYETSPRQITSFLTNFGLPVAGAYTMYYAMKGVSWTSEYAIGTPFARGALVLSGAAIFGTYALMSQAIFKKTGPYFNITVNPPQENPPLESPQISTQPLANNNDINIPSVLEPEINIPSVLEPEINFNPFVNLNPIAEDPDIAILSCGIIFILAAIQCLNFVLVRYLILKYSPKILFYLESYPSITKKFKRILSILESSFTLYLVGFIVLGYLALIGALIATLFLLHFMS